MPSLAELVLHSGSRRADSIRQRAQIEADRQRQSGATWGAAIQNLGQIGSQVAQSFDPAVKQAAADKATLTRQTIQGNQQNLDAGTAEQQAAQRAAATKKAMNDLLRGSITKTADGMVTYDRAKLQEGMASMGLADQWGTYAPLLDGADKSIQTARSAQTAAITDVAKVVDATGNDATVFAHELDRLVQNGVVSEASAMPFLEALKRDPKSVERITGHLLGKEPQKPLVTKPGDVLRDPTNPATVLAENPQEPAKPPTVGSFEDYVTSKFGPRPTPAQIEQARKGYGEAGRAPSITVNTGEPADPLSIDSTSQNILSQTGLTINAFRLLTGQSSQLARDKATREKAGNEAQAWARAHNVDISTLPAQYKTYNDVLSANISRLNNTKIMESELQGTIDNLQSVAKDADLRTLRFANVAKIWAGQEVNDGLAQQYALHLGQLRNELTAYYAATQGRTGNNITIQDQRDAELVIRNGIAKGSLDGLRTAIENSTGKMGTVMQGSVDRARKEVWSLFGVGQHYKGGQGGPSQQNLVATAPPDQSGNWRWDGKAWVKK